MSKWREAQGLNHYEAYIGARSRQAARQAVANTLRSGGFDAALLASKGSLKPLQLAPGSLSRLLDEEQEGSVQIERDKNGRITKITRTSTTN